MKTLDEIIKSPRLSKVEIYDDGLSGMISMPTWIGSIIITWGAGWEHASIAPFKRNITPSWDDMCRLKDLVFNDDEACIQIHPAKVEYVNFKPNCLHLFRCTYKEMVLPPACLIGPLKGQTKEELKKAIQEAYEAAGEKYEE